MVLYIFFSHDRYDSGPVVPLYDHKYQVKCRCRNGSDQKHRQGTKPDGTNNRSKTQYYDHLVDQLRLAHCLYNLIPAMDPRVKVLRLKCGQPAFPVFYVYPVIQTCLPCLYPVPVFRVIRSVSHERIKKPPNDKPHDKVVCDRSECNGKSQTEIKVPDIV